MPAFCAAKYSLPTEAAGAGAVPAVSAVKGVEAVEEVEVLAPLNVAVSLARVMVAAVAVVAAVVMVGMDMMATGDPHSLSSAMAASSILRNQISNMVQRGCPEMVLGPMVNRVRPVRHSAAINHPAEPPGIIG